MVRAIILYFSIILSCAMTEAYQLGDQQALGELATFTMILCFIFGVINEIRSGR